MTERIACIHSGLCKLGAPEDGDCHVDFPMKCPYYCSLPYDPQVERVLDKLDKMIMKRTDELLEEYHKLLPTKSYLVWERRLGVGEVLDMIAELRQNASEP